MGWIVLWHRCRPISSLSLRRSFGRRHCQHFCCSLFSFLLLPFTDSNHFDIYINIPVFTIAQKFSTILVIAILTSIREFGHQIVRVRVRYAYIQQTQWTECTTYRLFRISNSIFFVISRANEKWNDEPKWKQYIWRRRNKNFNFIGHSMPKRHEQCNAQEDGINAIRK